jgi:hypothetical protein
MKVRRHFPLGIGLGAALLLGSAMPSPADAAPDFQQVLAAPDDLQQNLAFARSEADAGRLLSAAAALERILLVSPDENGVRLFYVAVLVRLDDLQGAQQQLAALNQATLTPLQQAEAEKYRDRIARGRSSFKMFGNVAVGVTYDSNALGELNSELDFFGFAPPKKGGDTTEVSGLFDISDDLTPDGDLAAFAAISANSRTSFSGPNADYLEPELHLGLEGSELKSSWDVYGLLRTYQLLDTPYLTEYGGHADYSWRPDTSLTWLVSFEAVGQTYHEPLVASYVPFFIDGTHAGARFDVNGGASYRFDSKSTLTGIVGVETKTASYQPFAYVAPYIDGDFHSFLGSGVYLDASGEVRYVNYDKPDNFFLLGTRREDLRSTARLALGTPLSAFSAEGATGDYRENIILEAALTYTDRDSRYPVGNYNDVGAELRAIWKFGEQQ